MEGGVVSMSWLGRCWGRMEKMVGETACVKTECQQEGWRLLKPVEAESDGWDGYDGVCHSTALT